MTRYLTVIHGFSVDTTEETPMRPEWLTQEGIGTVNRDLLWRHLSLSPAQLAQLTGIPRRLAHRWAIQGLLIPCSRNPIRFNGMAVEQAIIMRHAIEQGYSPEQAAHFARIYQERQHDLAHEPVAPDMESCGSSLAVQEFIKAALKMALLDLHDRAATSKEANSAP
jgi:hypothetical protein